MRSKNCPLERVLVESGIIHGPYKLSSGWALIADREIGVPMHVLATFGKGVAGADRRWCRAGARHTQGVEAMGGAPETT